MLKTRTGGLGVEGQGHEDFQVPSTHILVHVLTTREVPQLFTPVHLLACTIQAPTEKLHQSSTLWLTLFLFLPQMYKDGKELCETIWDDSFRVSTDPCECLTLTASDTGFSASHSRHEDSDITEDLEATKADRRVGRRGLCPGSPLLQRLKKNLRKRSVFMEDVEGSGSGF